MVADMSMRRQQTTLWKHMAYHDSVVLSLKLIFFGGVSEVVCKWQAVDAHWVSLTRVVIQLLHEYEERINCVNRPLRLNLKVRVSEIAPNQNFVVDSIHVEFQPTKIWSVSFNASASYIFWWDGFLKV